MAKETNSDEEIIRKLISNEILSFETFSPDMREKIRKELKRVANEAKMAQKKG